METIKRQKFYHFNNGNLVTTQKTPIKEGCIYRYLYPRSLTLGVCTIIDIEGVVDAE